MVSKSDGPGAPWTRSRGAALQERQQAPPHRRQPADGLPQRQAAPWTRSKWQQRRQGTRAPATSARPLGPLSSQGLASQKGHIGTALP